MNRKVVGMEFVTEVKFESPISEDDFKRLHRDFMIKIDEIYHDVFGERCPKGCRGFSHLIYEEE